MEAIRALSAMKKICLVTIAVYIAIAAFGNLIMPYSVEDFGFEPLIRPEAAHLLGTDEMGHDIFSLLIYGFRTSIFIAFASGILSTAIGISFAFLASRYRGRIEMVVSGIVNSFLIIPEIILIMFFAVFASPSTQNTVMAIVFFSWTKVYKIVFAKMVGYVSKDKVLYTLLLKGNLTDVFKKLFHDCYPVIITSFILQCNKAIMYETTLSYFGVGNPLSKTWGKLIKAAMSYDNLFYDDVALWYLLPPIMCVFGFVLCISLLSVKEN